MSKELNAIKEGAKAPSPYKNILRSLERATSLPVNQSTYKIEKNVEIPGPQKGPQQGTKGRPTLYPFSSMKVKDSFFVDLETWKKRVVGFRKRQDKENARRIDLSNLQTSLATSARTYSERNKQGKWKFATRQQKNPVEGVRVWRIE